MEKVILVLMSMVILVCMTACDTASTSEESTQSPISEPPQDIYASQQLVEWNDEISLPFPAPNAERYEIGISGSVTCWNITKTDYEDYLAALKDIGWEALDDSTQEVSISGRVILLEDNMVIYIDNQIFDDVIQGHENHIRIEFTNEYIQVEPGDRMSKSVAINLIQDHISNHTEEDQPDYGKRVYHLVELYIEDSFEKMNLQAFQAFDKKGKINNYLICNGCVVGVPFLGETMVADIDQDGAYELLNICGWGSGMYRIELTAYKYGNPPYFDSLSTLLYPAYSNRYVPDQGYAELMLVKMSDTQVQLYGADGVKGELIPTTDYGLLKVEELCIYTDAPDSPFQRQSGE